ncbi:MAG: GNAT family N-acetyltransferase [Fusobacteriaceae bacterium]
MFKIEENKYVLKNEEKFRTLDSQFKFMQNREYFVDLEGEEILSYAEIEVNREEKSFIIHRIFVSPQERHKSYGKKMINFLEKKLKKFKCEKIVYPYDGNKVFFEKVGFKPDGKILIYNQIQLRKKRQQENNRVIIFSILGNIVLAITKIIWGIKGKSRALLSDGVNSLSDIGTSTGILIGVHYSNMPADEEHPYGHERIESIIANILGIFMILTAFELLRGTGDLLWSYYKEGGNNSIPQMSTIYWGIFSAIVKYFMYYYKIKVGKNTGNSALIADAKDSRNDIFTSLGAVLGIILAIYVNPLFDLLLSLPIALVIMKEGISVIFENAHIIMDKQDKEFLQKIEEYIYKSSDIKNVHEIQMRSSGDKIFLTMDIRVPGDMSVDEAHALADTLENSILIEFPEVKEVLIHVDPIIE